MKISRSEYLESCQICMKRSFNIQQGIVCSLTSQHAAYSEDECPNFDLDQPALDNKSRIDEQRQSDKLDSATLGMSKYGIKNQIVAGVLVVAIGLVWLGVGYSFGWIFFYPIILIVVGSVITLKGIVAEGQKVKTSLVETNNESSEILDDDLL